ncbi:MAG: hypothetical protein L0271_08440 [Gemmatimonadetes bacterium]|nr:hypothetical protein [Gemmatimonadota bacterium]
MRLPSGILAERAGSARIVGPESSLSFVAETIRRHGRLRDWAASHSSRIFQGRGPTYLVDGPDQPWVIRPARRGGTVASVLGDRYARLGTPRPIGELRTSIRARERGIDTPEIVAVVLYPAGLFYRADIATRYIPDSESLATLSVGPDRPPEERRIEAWRVTGHIIRVAARAGMLHADLNLRNVLISWSLGIARAHLLDLDRCRFRVGTSKQDRDAMVSRLTRSRLKLEAETGVRVGRAELAAFERELGG